MILELIEWLNGTLSKRMSGSQSVRSCYDAIVGCPKTRNVLKNSIRLW